MADASNLRARRLLAILHLLAPDTETDLTQIARALDISVEAAARDLELLAMCGVSSEAADMVPIYIEDERLVVYNPLPALACPVRLSASEARALVTALQAAGMDEQGPLLTALLDAAGSPETHAADLARVVRSSASPAQSATMRAAVVAREQRHVLRLGYQSAGTDEPSERLVEPMSLVNERGSWYLEAFCRKAGALRTFRMDRALSAEVTDEVFTPRRLSLSGRAFVADDLPVATVRLAPGEQFSSREWPGAKITAENPDGSLDVAVPYAGTGWIARQVAGRLGGAEALGPQEVREAVARLASGE
jgi:proteasome accessory factor C